MLQQAGTGDERAVEKPRVGGDPSGLILAGEARPAIKRKRDRHPQVAARDFGHVEGAAQFLERLIGGDREIQVVG